MPLIDQLTWFLFIAVSTVDNVSLAGSTSLNEQYSDNYKNDYYQDDQKATNPHSNTNANVSTIVRVTPRWCSKKSLCNKKYNVVVNIRMGYFDKGYLVLILHLVLLHVKRNYIRINGLRDDTKQRHVVCDHNY